MYTVCHKYVIYLTKLQNNFKTKSFNRLVQLFQRKSCNSLPLHSNADYLSSNDHDYNEYFFPWFTNAVTLTLLGSTFT